LENVLLAARTCGRLCRSVVIGGGGGGTAEQ